MWPDGCDQALNELANSSEISVRDCVGEVFLLLLIHSFDASAVAHCVDRWMQRLA